MRGKGVAAGLDRYVASAYLPLGVQRIDLRTDGRGSWFWATRGYTPDMGPDEELRDVVAEIGAMGADGLQRFMERTPQIRADERRRLLTELTILRGQLARRRFASMAELARFGYERRMPSRVDLTESYTPTEPEDLYYRPEGEETEQWIGRLALYSTTWSALKRLRAAP